MRTKDICRLELQGIIDKTEARRLLPMDAATDQAWEGIPAGPGDMTLEEDVLDSVSRGLGSLFEIAQPEMRAYRECIDEGLISVVVSPRTGNSVVRLTESGRKRLGKLHDERWGRPR